jgi:branched-chain amino acid transport system permease protein
VKELVVFVLLGLGPAALTAALALALVVQFRGSGMINLAAGAIATFGAYVFYSLEVQIGWSTLAAFASGLVACALFGTAFEWVVLRRLRAASALPKLIASLGMLLALQSLFLIRFGTAGQAAPTVLPEAPSSAVTVFGTPIPLDRIILAALVAVVAGVLSAVYRYTRLGLATRAAAENEEVAVLLGLAPTRLSMSNTVIATVLAGGFGMLVASQTQLDPTTITFAVVPALAAALLGGFTSFGIAAAAGMAIGILQTVLIFLQTKPWFPTVSGNTLPGVEPLLAFVCVMFALWIRGAKLPVRGAMRERRLPRAPEPRHVGLSVFVLTVGGAVLLVVFPPDFRQGTINSLIGFVLCLSLVVIIGYGGQVSLMQVALAGVAAFAVQKLTVHAGIPFPVGAVLAVAIAVAIGMVAAIPSLRVRGISLAIGTLAAAIALEQFVFDNTTFGQDASGSILPSPTIFGLHLGITANFPGWNGLLPSPVPGLECLGVALVLGVAVAQLRRSTLGQQMLAVRSNERAAAAAGVSVPRVKITCFALSSAIAAVAGVMSAYSLGSVGATDFGFTTALAVVAFVYIGGVTSIAGAMIGGLLLPGGVLSVALGDLTGLSGNVLALLGGISLIGVVVTFPEGLALAGSEQLRHTRNSFLGRRKAQSRSSGNPGAPKVSGEA